MTSILQSVTDQLRVMGLESLANRRFALTLISVHRFQLHPPAAAEGGWLLATVV